MIALNICDIESQNSSDWEGPLKTILSQSLLKARSTSELDEVADIWVNVYKYMSAENYP